MGEGNSQYLPNIRKHARLIPVFNQLESEMKKRGIKWNTLINAIAPQLFAEMKASPEKSNILNLNLGVIEIK